MKLLYLLTCMHIALSANILLEKPRIVSETDMQKAVADWQTCFQWKFGKGCNVICTYQDRQAGFLVQALFIPIRSYNFPYRAAVKQLMNASFDYYFEQPLSLAEQKPHTLTTDALCQLIQQKRTIFYTGAGLSASSDVATMHALEESLKLTTGIRSFLQTCFFDPTSITQAFNTFCTSAIEAPATLAHHALHQLAQYKECCILTENVDLLHERAGSYPLFVHADSAHNITPKDLQAVDLLVCIGLSHDDCGFIAHYKKNNPQGMLIAINKNIPSYLSDDDYLVQDDLQTVLPYVAQCLCDVG